MGTITESFANLTDVLLVDKKKAPVLPRKIAAIFLYRACWHRFCPRSIRCGQGTIVDIKDRQVGPFDIVGAWEAFPPVSDGAARVFPVDGVVFCLNARDWAIHDLTHYAESAAHLKKLERRQDRPLFCGAIAFEELSFPETLEFLKSPVGQPIDSILCVGHHLILRNSGGWYGNSEHIPFVTERSGPEALKAFTFFLLQLSQTAIGMPFGMADYQHL